MAAVECGLARKHKESLSLGSLVPSLFLLGLGAGPLVCWFVPPLWYLYIGTVVLYCLLVMSFTLALAVTHRSWRFLALLPIVYFTIHAASGWGVIREFCSKSATDRGEA